MPERCRHACTAADAAADLVEAYLALAMQRLRGSYLTEAPARAEGYSCANAAQEHAESVAQDLQSLDAWMPLDMSRYLCTSSASKGPGGGGGEMCGELFSSNLGLWPVKDRCALCGV